MAAADAADPGIHSFARTKLVLFALALSPVLMLANDYLAGELARPWKEMIVETGAWSLRFLVLALCLSPLIRLTGWAALQSFRRMIGLFAAFYAALHILAWTREYGFDWSFLLDEIVARRYLTIGAAAAALLVPLAATSPTTMHRLLGPARWQRLHLLIYPAVIAAFVHYAMARGLRAEVLIDAALICVAIAARLRSSMLVRAPAHS